MLNIKAFLVKTAEINHGYLHFSAGWRSWWVLVSRCATHEQTHKRQHSSRDSGAPLTKQSTEGKGKQGEVE